MNSVVRSLSRWSGALAILAVMAAFGAGPAPADDSLAKLTVQSFPKPMPAPSVTLTAIDGTPLRLDELRGKVVFLNFWATWCAPCRQEMPAMERLYRAYEKRGLAVVAVNFGESKADVMKFLDAQPVSFAIGGKIGDGHEIMRLSILGHWSIIRRGSTIFIYDSVYAASKLSW